jgi:glucose/arabinose dehydrogenase
MTSFLLLSLACRPDPETDTETETETETDTEDAVPFALTPFASGLSKPVAIEVRPGDADAVYVVEQVGRIQRVALDGTKTEFADLRDAVEDGGWEQGLLGLAFPADHATSGRFYVNFTRASDAATVIARFRVGDGGVADVATREDLLVVPQPYENHNAGHLAFGPDGYLYVGLGDGGYADDPHGHGQDATTLLGSMLRIDVSGASGYSSPSTNPFVGDDGIPDETWAIGLRNPWKYTFDAATGDLYIADVGQNRWEEIDVQPASSDGGENYGWNVMEGTHCFVGANCATDGLVQPIHEYSHGPACSITGGHVYRGSALPALVGAYFFADFCSNQLWSLRWSGGAVTDVREWTSDLGGALDGPSTFGVDAQGELYLANLNTGVILRFAPAPSR